MRTLMRVLRAAVCILGAFCLSACNTIEHRSDALKKSPLPNLSSNSLKPELVWSNTQSAGVGKSDAKLRFALTPQELVVADHSGKILVLARSTGRLVRAIKTQKSIMSGPTVCGDVILAGTHDGHIVAYRLSDGAFLWQANVGNTVLATPVGDQNQVFAHTLEDGVIALNAADGRSMWSYHVGTPPLMLRKMSSPVISDQHVIVGFANGKLVALDRMDGKPDWEKEVAISKGRSDLQRMVDISADPVVQQGKVYAVSYQGRIAVVSSDTGALLWERELSSYTGIAVAKEAVYVCDTQGVVWALNAKSGEVLWQASDLTGRSLSAPAVLQDYLVVGDEEGYLHWVSRQNGSFVGRVSVDGKGISATPVVEEDTVYALGLGGKVAAYRILPTKFIEQP